MSKRIQMKCWFIFLLHLRIFFFSGVTKELTKNRQKKISFGDSLKKQIFEKQSDDYRSYWQFGVDQIASDWAPEVDILNHSIERLQNCQKTCKVLFQSETKRRTAVFHFET